MIKSRISSVVHACHGIAAAMKTEANMKIHASVALLVTLAALFFDVSTVEWMILLICIGWVFIVEMINTSIEALCDVVTMEEDPKIKLVKDVSAGAVLVSAIMASIIGLLIFLPYIKRYFI